MFTKALRTYVGSLTKLPKKLVLSTAQVIDSMNTRLIEEQMRVEA